MVLIQGQNIFIFSLLVIWTKNIVKTESHFCTVSVSYQTKYYENCGWLITSWKKCTRERTQYRSRKICCHGWAGTQCDVAICGGKTDPDACNGYFSNSHIKYSDGSIQKYVDGTCASPDKCVCNKHGFFSTGPTCEMCTAISNCDLEVCTSRTDQTCSRCEGVVRETTGYRAYKKSPYGRRCDKACSWRNDSTPCYPGNCTDDLASGCRCASGFSGYKCDSITNSSSITYNALTLTDSSGGTKEAPGNVNGGSPQNTVWTNMVNPSSLHYKFTADYRPIAPTRPAFVTDFGVGIINGNVVLERVRKYSTQRSTVTHTCSGSQSSTSPNKGMFACEKNISSLYHLSPPFNHLDELRFTFSVSNGGFIKIENMETTRIETRLMSGRERSNSFKMTFDTVLPYHCTVNSGCSSNMLTDLDVTTKPRNRLSWDGWIDDNAGIDHYILEVFELKKLSSELSHTGQRLMDKTTTNKYHEVNFPNPGVFSVILAAYDRAGNHKSSRRLVIFDDSSSIDTIPSNFLRVTSALHDTNYTWQSDLHSVTIDWTGRYINKNHVNGGFLLEVETDPGVDAAYDDKYGIRTTQAIDNVEGIVQFKSVEKIDHRGGNSISTPQDTEYKDLKLNQKAIITPALKDGDTLRYFIRAYDIVGVYREENVTVHFDSSPPVIANLWLTKGDEVNLSVHGLEDLDKMTLEWIAYDDHSGLREVEWKILDHETGLEHGVQKIPPQGEASSMEACKTKYKSAARGANCYCTPLSNCYHRHFQINPPTTTLPGGGIHNNTGRHDHNYRLVVSVTNDAGFTSTLEKQITVDTSPPHSGVVHDGKYGNPEVDFQSDLDIFAHWEGFFDRESGVRFYEYGFSTSCLDASQFDVDLSKTKNIVKARSTSAQWRAPGTGKYHITVVAYNNAGEPSTPVCSDGVTIDTTPPVISEIDLEGSRIKGGLVKVDEDVYYISESRRRYLINQPDLQCVNKALSVNSSDISIFPLERYHDGSVHRIASSRYCSKTTFLPSFLTKTYLTKHTHLYVNWTGQDSDSGIYDYEFGLASDKDSISAPDLLSFTSTHHHAWYKDYHPQLSDGTEFYISIKAVNKAGLVSVKGFGPITVHTIPPVFNGDVKVTMENSLLKADWSSGTVSDPESSFLDYTAAVGTSAGSQDIVPYTPLTPGGDCILATPPSCTVFSVDRLHWDLHHNSTYYVSVRVENIVGLYHVFTSPAYVHNTRRPSKGVVFEVVPPDEVSDFLISELEDSNFQLSTSKLTARWFGFESEDLADHVTYRVSLGSTPGGSDVASVSADSDVRRFTFRGLRLVPHQTYYVTVRARSNAGISQATSNGVTIVMKNINLIQHVDIQDGPGCENKSDLFLWQPNHYQEEYSIGDCKSDLDYQPSTSIYSVHWTISKQYQQIYPAIRWTLQAKQGSTDDIWNDVKEQNGFTKSQQGTMAVPLENCRTYRSKMVYCQREVCSQPIYSDGVTVLSSPLTPSVHVDHSTRLGSQLVVRLTYPSQDEDKLCSVEATVDMYMWSLTDNHHHSHLYTKWTQVKNVVKINSLQFQFTVDLSGELDFSECRRLAVRIFNKAGLSTIVSTDIKNCSAVDPMLIVPSTVIDVVGLPLNSEDSNMVVSGRGITLEENAAWLKQDADYTPYSNIISAVWPTLRHKNYTWALIEDDIFSTLTHFVGNKTVISDPCSHPAALMCGNTEKEYINIFPKQTLLHGRRYHVCIHADARNISHEKWTEYLADVNACSDGVTVDLTPPSGGQVFVGDLNLGKYLASATDVSVYWSGFVDVEENGGKAVHPSGISQYHLAIGSVKGGEDIVNKVNVGLINHHKFHGLSLQNGHTYYITVEAIDFVNRSKAVYSEGFIVDQTPPVVTSRPVQFTDTYIQSRDVISVCWTGSFQDEESGLVHYVFAAGSKPGYDDVVKQFTTTENCLEAKTETDLTDGHTYYITVQAFNGAGLSSTFTSLSAIVDTTPPISGHVIDMLQSNMSSGDVDYVSDRSRLAVRWEGFHDPHSTIKYYKLKLGTCDGCDDVLSEFENGAGTGIRFMDVKLKPGRKYITTVTACNMAHLCTSASSDGAIVDLTPPTVGRVQDGTKDLDIEFQATRKYVGAKWTGFEDGESGIERYEWRVGTTVGGDELLKARPLPVIEIAYQSNIPDNKQLPVNTRIYVTVRCYNKAGLFSEATSNGFIVDTTLPIVTKKAVLSSSIGSVKPSTSISRSDIKVEWKFTDEESNIERQYISLSPHLQGDFNSSAMEIPSVFTAYILPGLDLHDGSKYNIKVIGCNLAGLCESSVTDDITVDSSPPSRGTFAVNTDHAANLNRDRDGWFSWSTSSLQVAWLGFSDLHTGISEYRVSVGSKPFFSDLNKDGRAAVFPHVEGDGLGDEGTVQTVTVDTKPLQNYTSVFISVTATNLVGLTSHPVHSEFELVEGGNLDLVRRCRQYNCEGHCVCAAEDKTCGPSSGCTDVTQGNVNSIINVTDIVDLQSIDPAQSSFTSSDSYLAAVWKVVVKQGMSVLRYDVSGGYSDRDRPAGIFQTDSERNWFDVGENTQAILTLPKGKVLHKTGKYSVFVRAWYDQNTYAIFKSPGITSLNSAPTVSHLQGVAVKELDSTSSTKDKDFQTSRREITLGWKNKFRGNIEYYLPYISTHPQGHNVHESPIQVGVNQTVYTASGLTLQENRDYYSAVLAYNKAGLVSWANSDGIRVDSTPPVAGIVHDDDDVHDQDYYSSSYVVSSSWHGFTDGESGLVSYHWCCGRDDSKTDCSVHDWKNVGLNTRIQINVSTPLQPGTKIYHKVYAVDGSGLKSDVAVSDGVTVDTTPPEPVHVEYVGSNLILNPSFEADYPFSDNKCGEQPPQNWKTDSESCLKLIRPNTPVSKEGETYLTVKGTIEQTVVNLEEGKVYHVVIHVGYPHDVSISDRKVEGFVQFQTDIHTFHLDPQRCQGRCDVSEQPLILWNKFTYVFVAEGTSGVVRIGTSRLNVELAVDDVYMREVKYVEATDDSNHFIHHTVFTPHWSSLHFAWHFKDDQSLITDYKWALGSVKGGTQIKPFSSVGKRQHVTITDLKLTHNTLLYLTVMATNAAGLYTVSQSEGIVIDVTPPSISEVNDGLGADVDYQLTTLLDVKWRTEDDESDVDFCEWAIGTAPGKYDIQKFIKVPKSLTYYYVEMELGDRIPDRSTKLFSTIRCYNKAGLPSIASTDGVVALGEMDVGPTGQLSVLRGGPLPYDVQDECHSSNDTLRLKWSLPDTGMDLSQLQILVGGSENQINETVDVRHKGYSGAVVRGISLQSNSVYNISLSTINVLDRVDNYLSTEIKTGGQRPLLSDNSKFETARSFDGKKMEVSWSDMFTSSWNDLYYEVSLGTTSGGADVIQWQETRVPSLVFSSPDKSKTPVLYLTVTAIDPCGLYTRNTQAVVL